jgi:hypothetical protein
MKKVEDASAMGGFGAQYALTRDYGALVRRYIEHGSDEAKGGVRENSWAEARDRAGAANVEAWWWRYNRELKNKYDSRLVLIAFSGFIAGFLAAAALVYFQR